MSDFQVVKNKKRRNKVKKSLTENNLAGRIDQIRLDMKSSEFYAKSLGLVTERLDALTAWRTQLASQSTDTVLQTDTTSHRHLATDGGELTGQDASPTKEMGEGVPSQASKCDSLVCYGLGNFADCYIARYQLAFLMALREDLQVDSQESCVYDPKFTSEEIHLLQQQGFTVLEVNEEGRRRCAGRVALVFMPHCGKALYNNLLWTNWGPELANLLLIGNSFSRMIDSTPSRVLKKTASYVMKIQPYTKEVEFPVTEQYNDIFSDTAVHSFLHHCTQEVPGELWADCPEPQYSDDDAEIIFNK